ncbi:unnamed protein product [Lampetra fluviatilis]
MRRASHANTHRSTWPRHGNVEGPDRPRSLQECAALASRVRELEELNAALTAEAASLRWSSAPGTSSRAAAELRVAVQVEARALREEARVLRRGAARARVDAERARLEIERARADYERAQRERRRARELAERAGRERSHARRLEAAERARLEARARALWRELDEARARREVEVAAARERLESARRERAQWERARGAGSQATVAMEDHLAALIEAEAWGFQAIVEQTWERYHSELADLAQRTSAEGQEVEVLRHQGMEMASCLQDLGHEANEHGNLNCHLQTTAREMLVRHMEDIGALQNVTETLQTEREQLRMAIVRHLHDHQRLLEITRDLGMEITSYR